MLTGRRRYEHEIIIYIQQHSGDDTSQEHVLFLMYSMSSLWIWKSVILSSYTAFVRRIVDKLI